MAMNWTDVFARMGDYNSTLSPKRYRPFSPPAAILVLNTSRGVKLNHLLVFRTKMAAMGEQGPALLVVVVQSSSCLVHGVAVCEANLVDGPLIRVSSPQIIMAKPAGGPKAPQGKKDWDEDD